MKPYSDITLNFDQSPKTEATIFLADGVKPLKIDFNGPFVRNSNGQIVCIDDQNAYLSSDQGESWQAFPVFPNEVFPNEKYCIANSHSLLCTKKGTLILSFIDMGQFHFNWRKKTNKPTKNCCA